jgi:hypothetical protein
VIGIFKQKNPANLFVLLITGIAIKLPVFTDPHQPVVHTSDGVLFEAILRFLDPGVKSFPLLYPLLAYSFLFIQAVMLTRFINNQRMMNKPTYLPGLAYLLISSLLPEWNYFSAPLLVNTVLLLILSWLFGIYNKHDARGTIFNTGLALGIAGFLFFPSLIFILWVLLALGVMRPFRIGEWLICLLGVITPSYFYGIYLFVADRWNAEEFLPAVTIGLPAIRRSAWLAGSVFLIIVPFLVGGYYLQGHLRRMLINVRKGWSLLLLFLLPALLLPFINAEGTLENWILGIVPLAVFHASAYLYATRRVFPLLLFWLTVAFIIAWQYYGPGW